VRVPGGLAVVVGVYVHKAGCDHIATGVDLLLCSAFDSRADCRDKAVFDRHITADRRAAAAVKYLAVSDYQVVVRHRYSPRMFERKV
jgi:hypothetical protein